MSSSVDFVYMNKFYSAAYQEDSIVPPDCFAIAPNDRISAVGNSPDCQSPVGCAGCPQNQFGSRARARPVPTASSWHVCLRMLAPKPVRHHRRAADLPQGLAAVRVERGLWSSAPAVRCLTHIEMDDSYDYAKLVFSDPQPFDDAEFIGMIRSRREEARERLLTEPDVAAMQAANDAKPKSKLKVSRSSVALNSEVIRASFNIIWHFILPDGVGVFHNNVPSTYRRNFMARKPPSL